ncbi:MAG: hypothetical protein ACLGXA_21705 [Acidobacteriota bacterium]
MVAIDDAAREDAVGVIQPNLRTTPYFSTWLGTASGTSNRGRCCEDIGDNLPPYTESVLSSEMNNELADACEEPEKALRNAMAEHRGNKGLMSVLLNTLLLYPDHPYDFEEIWARALDPATQEYYKSGVL